MQSFGSSCTSTMNAKDLANIRSDFANWVIPGKLMCGPYPGFDGINFETIEQAQVNLKNILDDGIDTFICLQSEIVNLENNEQHPYFPKYENYKKTMETRMGVTNIKYVYLPMDDHGTPNKRTFVSHMDAISKLLLQNRKIYIHCAGGHGRTGLYVACILAIMFPSYDVDYVMSYVQHTHDMRREKDKKCKNMVFVQSPNTHAQRQFVRDFSVYLKFT